MLTQQHLDAFIAKRDELSDKHSEILEGILLGKADPPLKLALESIRAECSMVDAAIERAKQDIATAAALKLCGFGGAY